MVENNLTDSCLLLTLATCSNQSQQTICFSNQSGAQSKSMVKWLDVFPCFGKGYMFSRALATVTCFPALGTGYMFSRALATVTCFPALWQWLHVFPRFGNGYMFFRVLATVTCFPALSQWLHVVPRFGNGYMFSRALATVNVFFRALVTVTCFLALWQWLHVFPRLELVTCFPVIVIRYMFSRAWHRLHVFASFVFPRVCHDWLIYGYL